ncbi:MAG: amidohydrolase family protein [Candidatus Lokiarchaeota archaeon]|nr:amidohydrolase family protein [Candidatus Lokiarchaeota archaeon]MBD3338676.1 amidohydrolase family protein [Candidatus Lokiarchaeota archaeon]
MIIDAHCHLTDKTWHADKWWDELAKIYVIALKHKGLGEMPLSMIKKRLFKPLFDPTGKDLIKNMDRAGIDKTIIFAHDTGLIIGEPEVPIEEQNRLIVEAQQAFPGRLIAYVTTDPRRPNAQEIVRNAFEEWDVKGLKLHQCSGFYPNTEEVYKLLDIVSEYKGSVVFHSGQIAQPLRSEFANPIYLDDICIKYPDMPIQAAHMGFGWNQVLFFLGLYKTNIIIDFSGWQHIAMTDYDKFCRTLRDCMNRVTSERVLFGTDNPYLRGAIADKEWVQMIKNLPEKASEGISFTEEEIELILGGNAQRIFGISE